MSKFAAWLPVGDGTRDRGEEARGIEYSKKSVKITKGLKTVKEIPVADIISVDAWREESTATKGQRAVGGALAGGILFGAAGAMVGAAAASNYAWYGEIVTETETVKFRFNRDADTNGLIKWWDKTNSKR